METEDIEFSCSLNIHIVIVELQKPLQNPKRINMAACGGEKLDLITSGL